MTDDYNPDYEDYYISNIVKDKIHKAIIDMIDHHNQVYSDSDGPDLEDIEITISVAYASEDESLINYREIKCWVIDSDKIVLRTKDAIKLESEENAN